jgi:hypothetical protein
MHLVAPGEAIMVESLGKCPSGDATAADAVVFAVVGKSADRPLLRYLDKPIPVATVRAAGVNPSDISHGMRISSNCAGCKCKHFESTSSTCSLAARVKTHVPVVVAAAPPCSIRKDCVWWHQEGVAACLRCPTVTRERTDDT